MCVMDDQSIYIRRKIADSVLSVIIVSNNELKYSTVIGRDSRYVLYFLCPFVFMSASSS
jgi:hypothetical protein